MYSLKIMQQKNIQNVYMYACTTYACMHVCVYEQIALKDSVC